MMARNSEIYDQEWRKAAVLVPADFKGLLAFRQFRLSSHGEYLSTTPGVVLAVRPPEAEDEFTLRSFFKNFNWVSRSNIAFCSINPKPHPVPSRSCTCGFYASYSSSIIYNPDHLTNPAYCFGAIRMYGENLPLAQNGLRSSGADVAGLLFRPQSRKLPNMSSYLHRLSQEGVYTTFSAKEFLRHFPDASYRDFLGFDPVQRLADLRLLTFESRSKSVGLKDNDYSSKFCRPLRPEMTDRIPVPAEDTDVSRAFEISLKPEYRPGGLLYRHPLLEAWGE
jgi:hypothetical protein